MYAHDDQYAPFAEHRFVPRTIDDMPGWLALKGTSKDEAKEDVELAPWMVIAPVYRKIRVGYIDVLNHLDAFHEVINKLIESNECEWSLYLTTINEYKSDIRIELANLSVAQRYMIQRQHPRFLWRAILNFRHAPALEMLFDATDIPHSFTGYALIWRAAGIREMVRNYLDEEQQQVGRGLRDRLGEKFFSFLRDASDHPVHVREPRVIRPN